MEGRPAKQFDEDEIIRLMEQGQSKSSIAAHMGISRPTLNKIIGDCPRLSTLSSFSNIVDEQVDQLVCEAKKELPLAGERIIIGFIHSKG